MLTSPKKPWTPPHWIVLSLVCLLVILLNAFDALATIEIGRRGGDEANPIAKPMFDRGALAFFLWKVGLSGSCAVMLALMSRVHRAAWYLSWVAVAVYAAIASLHVYLLWFIKHPS